MSIRRLLLVALVVASGMATAHTQIVTPRAVVVDGDTLTIDGERIRLWGIDAPGTQQQCDLAGRQYRCGGEAITYGWFEIAERHIAKLQHHNRPADHRL